MIITADRSIMVVKVCERLFRLTMVVPAVFWLLKVLCSAGLQNADKLHEGAEDGCCPRVSSVFQTLKFQSLGFMKEALKGQYFSTDEVRGNN